MSQSNAVPAARLVPSLFVVIWATGFIAARFVAPYAEPLSFVAARGLGLGGLAPPLLGFAVCLAVRGLALRYGWSLPTYRPRRGRSPDELGL